MKIKFDSNQDFQLDAIRSVVDVFAGQPLTRGSLQWQSDALGGELLTEMGADGGGCRRKVSGRTGCRGPEKGKALTQLTSRSSFIGAPYPAHHAA